MSPGAGRSALRRKLAALASVVLAGALVLPAAGVPAFAAEPIVVEPRRAGVEYSVEHVPGPGGGQLYVVTNDGAEEFRLMRAPVSRPGRAQWTEALAEDPAVRLLAADAFAGYLVLTVRTGGSPVLRVLDLATGGIGDETAGVEARSIGLDVNEEYDTDSVTVRVESLVEAPSWWAVRLSDGRRTLLKPDQVPGYDPRRYVTGRVTATAADGTGVPVTVARRAGVAVDGSAPALLHGYGAYESCEDPSFDPALPSLLDRGVVYAVAHVRGGGEGGRRWWQQGRLRRKPTTFSDYLAAADMLADEGWAAGDRIATRGLSAGGLLQGAVFSDRPERWRAVVAEVPFVDCVTTMLDPSIPLTVNEWDEWGDPRDAEDYACLASYAPYENVPAGPRPDLLVTASLHDPRVLVHEPAKWVARLRATRSDESRLLFRPELGDAAHTGPSGRYERLRYEAEILAFLLEALDVGHGHP